MFSFLNNTSPGNSVAGIFSNVSKTKIFIGFTLSIIVLISIVLFYYYVVKKWKVQYKENKEHLNVDADANKDAELILFSVDWCPHCKQAKPEWEQVKAEYNGTVVNGYSIVFTELNCTNETPDIEKMVEKYKIEGYPTIKLIKDGQVIEFDAKPTKSTLDKFIQTVLV